MVIRVKTKKINVMKKNIILLLSLVCYVQAPQPSR